MQLLSNWLYILPTMVVFLVHTFGSCRSLKALTNARSDPLQPQEAMLLSLEAQQARARLSHGVSSMNYFLS